MKLQATRAARQLSHCGSVRSHRFLRLWQRWQDVRACATGGGGGSGIVGGLAHTASSQRPDEG